ncbi:hypothetical protein C8F01DRAFT_1142329 [Mycena amicta]|nr:hypothetical protein C8F01DRAFT_1142329 [Mycena amicta]
MSMAMAGQCPPPMNTDISGIGMRVSFYLQTLFLSCLSARSSSLEEIMGALYTLLFTNTAMAVTALILGFKRVPEMSLQDAIVVFYLLMLSWTTVTLTLPAGARLPSTSPRTARSLSQLHTLSVLQSYTIFAFALALFATAPSFGSPSSRPCNPSARAVLFRPFPLLGAGRVLGFVLTGVLVLGYTGVLVRDHLPPTPERVRRWMRRTVLRRVPDGEQRPTPNARGDAQPQQPQPFGETVGLALGSTLPRFVPHGQYHSRLGARAKSHTHNTPSYDLQIAWPLLIHLLVVLVLWALVVMNTELLILWNGGRGGGGGGGGSASASGGSGGGGSGWGFGQILPMFLVLLPLANVVDAFREYGLRALPREVVVFVGHGEGKGEVEEVVEGKV